ncbi:MAG: YggS family pyridoxal phosphate-dependent enzyme [Chlorobi bacterium]|nr:YggS family pyridoxal phosphate-dependent enzyme [Chlorobiota bacterium]
MSIEQKLVFYRSQMPENVRLVAVSKTKPNEMVLEAYDAGQRIFGENKVQDLAAKQGLLPSDIQWHFIGHLQRNKVKLIAAFVDTIHAVDSLRLLKEIDKQAKACNRTIKCLMQFHIAEEESKFGLNYEEAVGILKSDEYSGMQNIQISGLMGMATYTNDIEKVRKEFKNLRSYFDSLRRTFFKDKTYFREISMGMSGDYKIAIEEGSTLIRIGTGIFGPRNY